MRVSCVALVVLAGAVSTAAWGQNPGSLKTVGVPRPDVTRYVRDADALVVLGKALFWDMQVSSDGRVACASCHFHAGADHRVQNQLSNPVGSFTPNYRLTAADFPFHQLANKDDNNSQVMRDTAQRVGSSGMFRRMFEDAAAGNGAEAGLDIADTPAFSIAGLNVRQVTVRNTPTVINAVFNFRQFWDGRASNIFTGMSPFGDSDSRLNALVTIDGQPAPEAVRIVNASLASQAVGPMLNAVEMAYDGRTWAKLGRRLLGLRPLAMQAIAADDSVLGPYVASDSRGFQAQITYQSLVETTFQPAYWNAGQAEANFPLFFGLAIQAYESTLVSDDSRFDRFASGETSALTGVEQSGLQLFRSGRGDCTECHTGAEFTEASFSNSARRGFGAADTGFFRTGVRPVADDIGLGGTDDFGQPFSIAVQQRRATVTSVTDLFKTPGLRNVEFTGPYFHNGGVATLEQVVDFYSRGGDFPQGNVGRGIRRLGLSADERTALVSFLKSLTDDRVRYEQAPFDHPELCVSVAHAAGPADGLFALSLPDQWALVPAVGAGGNAAPLQTFEELLQGVGTDGSRAHALTDPCPY
jgi:cytochrome c peroxidase